MVMSGNLQNFVYISSMKVLYRSGGGGGYYVAKHRACWVGDIISNE